MSYQVVQCVDWIPNICFPLVLIRHLDLYCLTQSPPLKPRKPFVALKWGHLEQLKSIQSERNFNKVRQKKDHLLDRDQKPEKLYTVFHSNGVIVDSISWTFGYWNRRYLNLDILDRLIQNHLHWWKQLTVNDTHTHIACTLRCTLFKWSDRV